MEGSLLLIAVLFYPLYYGSSGVYRALRASLPQQLEIKTSKRDLLVEHQRELAPELAGIQVPTAL